MTHEIELTSFQQVVFETYTSKSPAAEGWRVELTVDNQQFILHPPYFEEEEAEWMRKMLAKALSRLVEGSA